MKTKTLRLSEDILRGIKHRAETENVDEATAMRQLIRLGIFEHAVKLYRDGRITLQEAADVCEVSIRKMLDILWEYGVKGNVTFDQQRKAIEFVSKMTNKARLI